MKSTSFFLLFFLSFSPFVLTENASKNDSPDREKILQQMQSLAGGLDHMPKVPEMHHTIILPENPEDSEETDRIG